MKTAIATVSISGDLREKLAAIAAAGFDGIEIFENDFLASDLTPRDVAKMVRDHGLEISLFQPFRDFEGMPEPARQQAFDRAERKFDVMGELGADLILVCSNVSQQALGGIGRAAADLVELGERAQKRGIRIGYEALAWGRYVNDHRDAWEVVRRSDHPSVGLVLDSFHSLARDIDSDTIRAIPGDRIFFVQLADAPRIDMDLLYWSRHFRNMPGQGDLDVAGFMRAVAATGYDGTISLEIFNDGFRGGSPRLISTDGLRSLHNLMDRVRRDEPTLAIQVPAMPDRATPKGIEFVEFAAGDEEAKELGGLLASLGFEEVGRHVSKKVGLWRQGGINILLNTDPEGFAHSTYLLRGTNVCDIGIKVDDADATTERARALGSAPFEQAVGPGELRIPAVRDVSGASILHFIDDKTELGDLWRIDFEADEKQGAGAGLTRIDHLAQTMDYEEMLSAVLFHSALMKTHKRPMVDVADPGGLIRSQAVESEDGALRFTLNAADNRQTLAGHFLAQSLGAAVQHIAFATDDIFATLDRLIGDGFTPLTISPNYYDDLAARFTLDDDLLAAMKARKILYDEDEGGAYLQAYSRTYGEGFFFEIVERRGGYAGYGAPNAPFRIAAQKRDLPPKGMPRI